MGDAARELAEVLQALGLFQLRLPLGLLPGGLPTFAA